MTYHSAQFHGIRAGIEIGIERFFYELELKKEIEYKKELELNQKKLELNRKKGIE